MAFKDESLSTLRSMEKPLAPSARGSASARGAASARGSSTASSAPQPIKGFTRVMAFGVTISRVIQEFVSQKIYDETKKN